MSSTARNLQIMRNIAANVRRLRERRDLTQAQLAEAAGIALRYVQVLESGRGNPSASLIVALADALGTSPGMLFRAARFEVQRRGRPKGK